MAKKRSGSRGSRLSFRQPLSLARPALVGGAGALVVNGVMNSVPLPATLLTGNMVYLTRAGVAILLGVFGPRLPFVGRYAREMAIGSLIVTAADFGKQIALAQGINLAGLGYSGAARRVNMGLVRQGGARMLARPSGLPGMAGASGMGKLLRVVR